MSHNGSFQVAVIGGGIVGLSVARSLLLDRGVVPIVLEAEPKPAMHQTGHNSGVIHSGLYYRTGSRKAKDCVTGRDAMYEFCRQHAIDYRKCGKLVVSTSPQQTRWLENLEQRGKDNGLEGTRRLSSDQMREYEPHVRAEAGLWVPQTGIVDFGRVSQVLASELSDRGAEVRTRARVNRILRRNGGFVLETEGGRVEADNLINCAGLHSDRIARRCGLDPGLRIVPFRGEYYHLAKRRGELVRKLIYPVPVPGMPFLGVHFTRNIHEDVEVGPNAVLAFKREGYKRWSFSARDAFSALSYAGFWRMAARNWRFGLAEQYRSVSKRALVKEVQKMIPDIGAEDLERGGSGVRAQAIARDGALIDDFHIVEGERMTHVLNAPSPAATASLVIGRYVASRANLQ